MNFDHSISIFLHALLSAGLGAAYLAAAAGLVGILDARTVAFVAFSGAAVALVAVAVYFATAHGQLRRSILKERQR